MKYNDHIIFINNDEKLFGRFIAYRPDKQTIVFEHAGLKELPENEVRKAEHDEICNYYGQIIADFKSDIKGDQNMIAELTNQIRNQKGTLKNRRETLDKLSEESEKILTCLTIAGVDIRRDCDDGFTALKYEFRSIRDQIRRMTQEVSSLKRKIEMKDSEIGRRRESIADLLELIKENEDIRDEYLKDYREAKEHNEFSV